MHEELCDPFRIHSVGDHLVVADDCSGLEHTAEDCLLAHEVGFNFSDERRLEDARLASAHSDCQSLRDCPALSFRVVNRVDCDEVRNTESSVELVVDFRAGTFRSAHHDGDVLANLHSFLNHVEAVAVPESGSLLHEFLHFGDDGRMLLVRSEVADQISGRNHLRVRSNFETVLRGVLP